MHTNALQIIPCRVLARSAAFTKHQDGVFNCYPRALRLVSSVTTDADSLRPDADSMDEEAEFNWEEYMEETGANAAPHTTFKHVSDCV